MITLAFLGCGRVARAHAKRLGRHRKHVELAFASRDPARAQAFARDLGGNAFASYDEALASDAVDVAVITTPPSLHKDLALRALAAKKHVVLEKPAVAHAADLDDVAAAAAAAGKRVFVAENYFYKPSLRRVRSLITQGAIGEVLFVHANAIRRQETKGDWRDDPAIALGGALYEGGIHWIDFMSNLGLKVARVRGFRPGEPVTRSASDAAAKRGRAEAEGRAEPEGRGPGEAPRAAAGIDRSMMIAFEYDEGAVGMLSYSWEVPSSARGLRLSKIYGRAGTITFESNGLWTLCHGKKLRFYVGLRDHAGYRAMWADFVGAWREDRDAAMTLAHARRDLELVEQAQTTAEDHA